MGYDMYVVAPDEADVEAAKKLHDEFSEEARRRDALPKDTAAFLAAQECVTAAYQRMHSEDKTYYRLNVWAMSRCRDYMQSLGMLCNPPRDRFPEPGDFGTTWELAEQLDEVDYYRDNGRPDLTPEQEAAAKAYNDAVAAHLAAHCGECPGIPGHKFGSNDGWLVTPAEIDAALHAYLACDESQRHAERDNWWPEWIAWLDYARQHEGFTVR